MPIASRIFLSHAYSRNYSPVRSTNLRMKLIHINWSLWIRSKRTLRNTWSILVVYNRLHFWMLKSRIRHIHLPNHWRRNTTVSPSTNWPWNVRWAVRWRMCHGSKVKRNCPTMINTWLAKSCPAFVSCKCAIVISMIPAVIGVNSIDNRKKRRLRLKLSVRSMCW